MSVLEWFVGRFGTTGLTIAVAVVAALTMVGYTRGVILLSPGQARPQAIAEAAGSQQVHHITDGDSFRLIGIDRAIRLAGADAPESSAIRFGQPECLGDHATDQLRHLLAGGTVDIELAEDPTDRYDRIVAYVWIDVDGHQVLVNEAMIRSGLAYAVEYRPNTRYSARLFAAETAAIADAAGVWGVCPIEEQR